MCREAADRPQAESRICRCHWTSGSWQIALRPSPPFADAIGCWQIVFWVSAWLQVPLGIGLVTALWLDRRPVCREAADSFFFEALRGFCRFQWV